MLGLATPKESVMRRFLLTIFIIASWPLGLASRATQNEIVFLEQTKSVGGQAEWNREIAARNAGTISIKIKVKEGGKFSVLLLTDEDYQVVTGKKSEPDNFKPKAVIDATASNSFEKVVKLEKGAYWFIIENQENTERNISLICSQIK